MTGLFCTGALSCLGGSGVGERARLGGTEARETAARLGGGPEVVHLCLFAGRLLLSRSEGAVLLLLMSMCPFSNRT
jgi:hypothetical protein